MFLSGCGFVLVSLFRIRDTIIDGIPLALRVGISAGIGLFLAIIALKNAGIVAADKATLVTLGDLHAAGPLLAVLGFFVATALSARRVPGALLIGILVPTALGFVIAGNRFTGLVAMPPSIAPTLFALDIPGALGHGLLDVVLVFFLVEMFDTTGTLLAVARRAGLLAADGTDASGRFGRSLVADSSAILVGAVLGTSSTTAYLESAAGVEAGGRTGLTAIVVALLFLGCLMLSPLAGSIPAYATAPALLYVGCLMLGDLAGLRWDDPTEAIPAAVTALAMPFTFSIANGIAFGFITYVVLKALAGRFEDVKPIAWLIAVLFVFRFAWIGSAG